MKPIYSLFFFTLIINDFIFSNVIVLENGQDQSLDNYNSETLLRIRRKGGKRKNGSKYRLVSTKALSENTTTESTVTTPQVVNKKDICKGRIFGYGYGIGKTFCWIRKNTYDWNKRFKKRLDKLIGKKDTTTKNNATTIATETANRGIFGRVLAKMKVLLIPPLLLL
uniref:Uncharacterized protein n=1 Tax=Strongyloides papillosus TaxID=174720 RepID=A0A0N5CCK3_STREA